MKIYDDFKIRYSEFRKYINSLGDCVQCQYRNTCDILYPPSGNFPSFCGKNDSKWESKKTFDIIYFIHFIEKYENKKYI